jgi:hypothetical protein
MAQDVTPTPDRPVFVASSPGLRLTRIGGRDRWEHGVKQELYPSLAYVFDSDGFLIVDDALHERDKRYFDQYRDAFGGAHSEEPAEDWLRAHGKFNVPRGFVENVPAPPDPSPVLNSITDALVANDEQALVRIYEEEEQGWAREPVLDAAKHALHRLEEAGSPAG